MRELFLDPSHKYLFIKRRKNNDGNVLRTAGDSGQDRV